MQSQDNDNLCIVLETDNTDIKHTVVVGKTGVGKSSFVSEVQIQIAAAPGAQTVIVDKGPSSNLLAGLLRRI